MIKLFAAVVVALACWVHAPAFAGGASCKGGYYFNEDTLTCVKQVRAKIGAQDLSAMGGAQWGPVNAQNCASASAEMDRSAAQCRSYDARQGAYDAILGMVVDGKLLEECSKCCRQLREGMNRWKLCHQAGFAPPPDTASARRSATAMNCPETY